MRKKLCVLAMATAVLLTGCGASVPKLSKLDNSLAAQYLADAMLRNDADYADGLDYDHALLTATPTPAPTVAPTQAPQATEAAPDGQDQSTDKPGASAGESNKSDQQKYQSVSLSEIFGSTKVKVKAQGYQMEKSYGTSYASCTAGKGKKLVVANFSISNTSKSAVKVNLAKQNLQAELIVNGKSVATPLQTIVDGDLQFFNKKLGAGQKKQGILIFEVDKSMKGNDVQIHFVNGSKEANVSMH